MWFTPESSPQSPKKTGSASAVHPTAKLPIGVADPDASDVGFSSADMRGRQHLQVPGMPPTNSGRRSPKVTVTRDDSGGNFKRAPSSMPKSSRSERIHSRGERISAKSLRSARSNTSKNLTERVQVEFFVSDSSTIDRMRFFCFRSNFSLVILWAFLVLKLATCALYVARVIIEDKEPGLTRYEEYLQLMLNASTEGRPMRDEEFPIDWDAILWTDHPMYLWATQVGIAIYTLPHTLIFSLLQYKGNIWKIFTIHLLLELITTVPFYVTLAEIPRLSNLFIPVFLNCWIAKKVLQDIFNHQTLQQQANNIFSKKVVMVILTLLCFVFTCACGFQHLQRGGRRHFNLLESIYFVVVSLATVGFGDVVPDIWPSQLYVILIVCVAVIILPKQFESLATTWMEKQRLGGSYRRSHNCFILDRHVVVCATLLSDDMLLDFMNEFYSHRHLQDYHVVLLSPSDLDPAAREILQYPLWSQRVMFVKGSCLRNSDLFRVKMQDATACFLLGVDNTTDKAAADEHTILRSWAVRDFAPSVPQYVQIFRPENKVHVQFAEFVTCEDEFKYALLAYNCIIPGTSTLITLLLHTSKGEEGQACEEPWLRLYGRCSGNEIYSIQLETSIIFGEYDGKSFSFAAVNAHKKFGALLIGIQPADKEENVTYLNPGSQYKMKTKDICFYLCINREEDMTFMLYRDNLDFTEEPTEEEANAEMMQADQTLSTVGNWMKLKNEPSPPLTISHFLKKRNGLERPYTANTGPNGAVADILGQTQADSYWINRCERSPIVTDFPPVTPYVGTSPSLCYILKEKKPLCCLQLASDCEHSDFKNVADYQWGNPAIILAADNASSGIFNFLLPLRSHYHSKAALKPIVLLLNKEPSVAILDTISCFPLIYWAHGSIDNLDDWIKAGITFADNVVVVNKDLSRDSFTEEDLSDCNTIVSVQTIYKYFPNVNITTELSQSSNMRFMQFQARNAYTLYMSEVEKREKARGSTISFMFRLQFAAGNVFSASMVDTLLYQGFVKDYVISVVRLLLGIDQAPGSGFLTSISLTQQYPWSTTYGTMFQHICTVGGGDIPLAIYRTHVEPEQYAVNIAKKRSHSPRRNEDSEISNLVKSRIDDLGLHSESYKFSEDSKNTVSYVIINPNDDLELEVGDVIFVIRPVPTTSQLPPDL